MNTLASMITKRIVFGVLTLMAISLLIFVGVEALPGDLAEAILGQNATPETVQAFRTELKLDLPAHERYFSWIGDFVQGDLGNSLANGRPIAEVIGWRFANSLLLAGTTALFAIPLAIILGLLAAIYRDSWFDRFISITTLSAISLPEFFVAYILIALFSVQISLFPSISNINDQMSLLQKMHAIFLPCLTLTFVVVGHMMRMTRAAIINVLSSPFIEMATLKGIARRRIIVNHALPNALSPIINVVILNLAYLVVGVVVVEVVFVYPGLGQLLVDAVAKRDLPVVQASGLIFASTYVFLNLTADVLSMLSNPKLRNPK
ncbi:MAG: peptide/nickel transport system permease protein [Desulforhopalus sp.]|jgi:peptide/nickel transport system permease protein